MIVFVFSNTTGLFVISFAGLAAFSPGAGPAHPVYVKCEICRGKAGKPFCVDNGRQLVISNFGNLAAYGAYQVMVRACCAAFGHALVKGSR